MESVNSLYDAMADHGINFDGVIEWSPDEYQRFSDLDKGKKNEDIYVFIYPNGRCARFGSKADPDKNGFIKLSNRPLTPTEKREMRRAKEKKEREKKEAAAVFTNFWKNDCSVDVDENHSYLVSKKIPPWYCRQYTHCLVIGIFDITGSIRGVQMIYPSGHKRFPEGCLKRGNFTLLGERITPVIRIVEGWATGMSVHLATGDLTVVCFDSGNMRSVAQSIRDWVHLHKLTVVVCADQDPAGHSGAIQAARILGNATIIAPIDPYDFDGTRCYGDKNYKKVTDFNDIHTKYGLEAVEGQLSRNLF